MHCELIAATRRFGERLALDDVSFDVRPGEILALLGPNGAGKTTTLRLLAGLIAPTSGTVRIGDEILTPAAGSIRARIGLLTETPGLWDRLTVRENLLTYARLYAVSSPSDAVDEVLRRLDLGDRVNQPTAQLSKGLRQRVALARALVLNPRVLLLDEPLGALDARLRKNLQVELKALQGELGITFVFVTHDQEEALTMSDRLAIMNGGRVEQAGSPREVYEEPETVFVANFLGVSNLLTADAVGRDGGACTLRVGERVLRAEQGATASDGKVTALIRPERVGVEAQGGTGDNRLPGMVERSVFLGGSFELHVRVLGGDLLRATVPNDGSGHTYEEGAPVTLHLPADAVRVLAAGA